MLIPFAPEARREGYFEELVEIARLVASSVALESSDEGHDWEPFGKPTSDGQVVHGPVGVDALPVLGGIEYAAESVEELRFGAVLGEEHLDEGLELEHGHGVGLGQPLLEGLSAFGGDAVHGPGPPADPLTGHLGEALGDELFRLLVELALGSGQKLWRLTSICLASS